MNEKISKYMIIIGVAVLFKAIFMNTTVKSGTDSIHNIGLMNDRIIYTIIGSFLLSIGFITLSQIRKQSKESLTEEKNDTTNEINKAIENKTILKANLEKAKESMSIGEWIGIIFLYGFLTIPWVFVVAIWPNIFTIAIFIGSIALVRAIHLWFLKIRAQEIFDETKEKINSNPKIDQIKHSKFTPLPKIIEAIKKSDKLPILKYIAIAIFLLIVAIIIQR